jgi:hypothetical protein
MSNKFEVDKLRTSRLKPGLRTTDEKPKFGRDGATTWNAGAPPTPDVNSGSNLMTSMNDPGPARRQLERVL